MRGSIKIGNLSVWVCLGGEGGGSAVRGKESRFAYLENPANKSLRQEIETAEITGARKYQSLLYIDLFLFFTRRCVFLSDNYSTL